MRATPTIRAPLDRYRPARPRATYSRAYLHHLVKVGEILGMMLLTEINLAYYQELMAGMRAAIGAGRLADFIAETRAKWIEGESA